MYVCLFSSLYPIHCCICAKTAAIGTGKKGNLKKKNVRANIQSLYIFSSALFPYWPAAVDPFGLVVSHVLTAHIYTRCTHPCSRSFRFFRGASL